MSAPFEVVGSAFYDPDNDALVDNCPATAAIGDIFPAAQKIQASDLRVGDLLFDAFGGTHAIAERRRQRRGWITTVREDGWEDHFHHADTLTIIRPTEED